MRPLGGRQAAGDGLWLRIIVAAVQMLERIDAGQDKGWAKAARKPGERARPKARTQPWHNIIDRRDMVLPVLGVRILDRRQASINLRQLRVLLGLRQGSVKGGTVDLTLKIGRVAPSWIFLRHLEAPCARLS